MKSKDTVDKNSRSYLLSKVAGARYSLLLIIIFTLVNLVMILLDVDRYFLFSASVPYYLTLLGKGMDNGFCSGAWDVNGTYTITALVISAVILVLYFLSWLLSGKKGGWLTAALVLFVLDSSALILFTYVLYGSPAANILDLLLHAWALWELFQGVRSNKKLKALPPERPVDPGEFYNSMPEL